MWQAMLFLFLGLAGSAGPAHFGMRVLSHRQQLDRRLAFAPGTEDGGFLYSWWLMRFGQARLGDAALRQFGNLAGIMGWLTLIGVVGTAVCIAAKAGIENG
ncbi:hypothetical protein [Arenimonas oryziterrae]|uniref:Uncharacterized protein n=1 Tax=Arenimonas oryziterrae DSM 21050 = YC6267 TaxID=1121015 RepID=A0A091B162_9GAMM|nr:hypothetical protein [Arenimonas oryziterrae]KFN44614.1 hypothetical protein N789_00990 [Arenimonas oryziterrae DSM 21050 = YC6267]